MRLILRVAADLLAEAVVTVLLLLALLSLLLLHRLGLLDQLLPDPHPGE